MRHRFVLICIGLGLVVGFASTVMARELPAAGAYAFSLALSIAAGLMAARWLLGRDLAAPDEVARALDHLARRNFEDVITDEHGAGAFSGIVQRLNALGRRLRAGQDEMDQREQMLRTVIDAAPMAIVLLDSLGHIAYTNETARTLFFEGKKLDGHNFLAMLDEAPAPFREAVLGNEDALFTVDAEGEQETYHLAKRHFDLGSTEHVLIMVKHMTREMRRQEVDVWKKLIRVISHELNNSLAPITSLVHSARLITSSGVSSSRLATVFDTIEDRAKHLQEFVEGYARFARLPKPRRERVNLEQFVAHIRELAPYAQVMDAPKVSWSFDRSQLEHVLLNLLRNAQEAEGPPDSIRMELSQQDDSLQIVVADRGKGMSEEVLKNALLPFYSTKERGTGLGLALCREILEAHGGKIRIENRAGGGAMVTCSIPAPQTVPASAQAKLTLSRL